MEKPTKYPPVPNDLAGDLIRYPQEDSCQNMKNTGRKHKGAKGSRKKKSIGLAATEAAATSQLPKCPEIITAPLPAAAAS